MARRIDIVTHYWPPIGGPGSRKMQMWARTFLQAGYRVRVITPEPSERDLFYDASLGSDPRVDVVRLPIFDPARFFRSSENTPAAGRDDSAPSLARRVAGIARDLVHLPDQRRMWSRKAAASFLRDPGDVLVTTSPYDSTHLVGLAAKRRGFQGMWVADFRDRWDHRRWIEGPVSAFHSRYNDRLERRIVDCADLLTYSNDAGLAFAEARTGAMLGDRAIVVRNGLSAHDLEILRGAPSNPSRADGQRPRFVHVGTIWPYRMPEGFVEAWQRLMHTASIPPVLHQYGAIDPGVSVQFEPLTVNGSVVLHGAVPRTSALAELARADAIILFIGPVTVEVASKLYEAIAAGKPILYLGAADGAGAELLRKLGAANAVVDIDRGDDLRGALARFTEAVVERRAADWTPRPAPDVVSLDRQMDRLLARLPPPR